MREPADANRVSRSRLQPLQFFRRERASCRSRTCNYLSPPIQSPGWCQASSTSSSWRIRRLESQLLRCLRGGNGCLAGVACAKTCRCQPTLPVIFDLLQRLREGMATLSRTCENLPLPNRSASLPSGVLKVLGLVSECSTIPRSWQSRMRSAKLVKRGHFGKM